MNDGKTVEQLAKLAINYTKWALNKVYPEQGIIDFAKIVAPAVYATRKGVVHFIFLDGVLELEQGEIKIFRSKAQFTLNGQAVKPELLELKFTVSNRTQQFYFEEEIKDGHPVYQMWESNYIKKGGELNKTG